MNPPTYRARRTHCHLLSREACQRDDVLMWENNHVQADMPAVAAAAKESWGRWRTSHL